MDYYLNCPVEVELDLGNWRSSEMEIIREKLTPAPSYCIDAYRLVHREAYDAGDYLPAVKEFQRQMVILTKIHNRRCTLIFDGMNGRHTTTNTRGATAMGCGKAPPTPLWCGCPNQQFLRAPK